MRMVRDPRTGQTRLVFGGAPQRAAPVAPPRPAGQITGDLSGSGGTDGGAKPVLSSGPSATGWTSDNTTALIEGLTRLAETGIRAASGGTQGGYTDPYGAGSATNYDPWATPKTDPTGTTPTGAAPMTSFPGAIPPPADSSKDGMSTGTAVGLTAGAAALVGVGIYVTQKKR
jgi:hypothetical protein